MTVRALLAETLTTHDGTGVDHLFGLAADSTVGQMRTLQAATCT